MRWPSRRARWIVGSVLVVALGAAPAWSYWTAQVKAPAPTLNVGHLDLTAAKTGTVTLDIPSMYPGATAAQVYQVANAGSIPLSFFANAWVAGAMSGSLLVTVTDASAAAGAFPTASCPGTVIGASASALPSTSPGARLAYASPAASRAALKPSAGPYAGTPSTATICVQAQLATTAPNALQGSTATVNVQFMGEQVGQP